MAIYPIIVCFIAFPHARSMHDVACGIACAVTMRANVLTISFPEAAILLVSDGGLTPEVRDSRTFRHSAHAQSQVWQIWLHSRLQSHDPSDLRQGWALALSNTGNPRFTDYPSDLANLANLIGWEYETNILRMLRNSGPARALDPCRRSELSWTLGTRMIWLVLVPIFPVHDKRDPWGQGWRPQRTSISRVIDGH